MQSLADRFPRAKNAIRVYAFKRMNDTDNKLNKLRKMCPFSLQKTIDM